MMRTTVFSANRGQCMVSPCDVPFIGTGDLTISVIQDNKKHHKQIKLGDGRLFKIFNELKKNLQLNTEDVVFYVLNHRFPFLNLEISKSQYKGSSVHIVNVCFSTSTKAKLDELAKARCVRLSDIIKESISIFYEEQ